MPSAGPLGVGELGFCKHHTFARSSAAPPTPFPFAANYTAIHPSTRHLLFSDSCGEPQVLATVRRRRRRLHVNTTQGTTPHSPHLTLTMATTAATLARWLAAAALTRAPVGRPRVAACAVGAAHLAAYMRAASLSTTAMVPPAVVAAAAGDGGRALKGLPGTTSSVIRLVEERGTKFYVDKAAFIPALERAGRVITLVRPQRWGKSMFMNLLEAYYDCARVSKPLVHVPGGNTAGANKFTILRFDLMGIAKAAEGATTEHDANAKVGAALDDLVVRAVEAFIARYEVPAGILTAPMDPMSCLQAVCAWAKQRGGVGVVLHEGGLGFGLQRHCRRPAGQEAQQIVTAAPHHPVDQLHSHEGLEHAVSRRQAVGEQVAVAPPSQCRHNGGVLLAARFVPGALHDGTRHVVAAEPHGAVELGQLRRVRHDVEPRVDLTPQRREAYICVRAGRDTRCNYY